ncbi:MAG: N-acetylmuramoyl-L-alanine amidase [Bacteroidia bacterium]|nr:N-acetylmuramoyl-L-alanine amidase [Bacteroidia bacterium]
MMFIKNNCIRIITPILSCIGVLFSQDIQFYKARFDKYLNLNHQLDKVVLFYPDKIILRNINEQSDLVIYKDEIPAISAMLESEKLNDLEVFFQNKKNKHLNSRELDSILISVNEIYSLNKKNHLPLSGIRIAIDPGHFADDINTAKIEQRLLYFKHKTNNKIDTITLIEGKLTFQTAIILAEKLKEQGAEILLTRQKSNATAFGISFEEWYQKRKNVVLDSLLETKELTKEKYLKLKSCSKQQFFNLFFREYELLQRAKIINAFNPHLSVIIHFNVDEKNNPWNKATFKNYSMCFIGGAFEENDLKTSTNKIHFLRLLLTNQIENSKKISSYTMQNFENNLSVSAAKTNDATYLQSVCIPSENPGVFCRNLLLTRHIISPLVYGESMCQDNFKECQLLSQNNYKLKEQKVPYRIYEVAKAYFDAIMKYFKDLLPN